MSFIFGGRCADGAVVAADRRVLRGLELGEDSDKVYLLGPQGTPTMVVSFAGVRDFGLRLVDVLRENREQPLAELVRLAKTTLREIWDANKDALRDDARVDALLAGYDEGGWRLFLVSCEGWAEESPLECLGDGGGYARSLARALWDHALPGEELWQVAVFVIGYTGQHHVSVGGTPDVFLLRDGGGVERVEEERVLTALGQVDMVAAGLRRTLLEGLG